MEAKAKRSLLFNRMSLAGIVIATVGFIAATGLLLEDYTNPSSSSYSGLITYMLTPAVMVFGLMLVALGANLEYRRRRSDAPLTAMPVIDLNDRRQYVAFVLLCVLAFVFIVLTGIGGFRAYQYTESVDFCGKTCHVPMEPEHVAYGQSPHANVRCVDCHIGPGAESFIKSKLNGLHQVVAVITDNYHRPIETPIPNLRPAAETCYECHWPAKFFGVLDWSWTYFKADKANTPYTVGLLLKVGGADPSRGKPHGIHWHVSSNKVEYIAKDHRRQVIPWVRVTDTQGKVTVYKTSDKAESMTDDEMAKAETRTMDCIDCHTRPSHQYFSPNRALDMALTEGRIDSSIHDIKKNAAKALLGTYRNKDEAFAGIETQLRAAYPEGGGKVDAAIAAIKQVYGRNFFPEMNVRWDKYPDNIGHMIVPGCFRCHDGKHQNEQGVAISKDCTLCHVITAQGPGSKLASYAREGVAFEHPADDDGAWKEDRCDTCHSGVPDL